jgi:hypothetical protein
MGGALLPTFTPHQHEGKHSGSGEEDEDAPDSARSEAGDDGVCSKNDGSSSSSPSHTSTAATNARIEHAKIMDDMEKEIRDDDSVKSCFLSQKISKNGALSATKMGNFSHQYVSCQARYQWMHTLGLEVSGCVRAVPEHPSWRIQGANWRSFSVGVT